MANRTARLRREQEAYEQQRLFRTALRNSKQIQRQKRSARRLQRRLEMQVQQDEQVYFQTLRGLLRRKSVRVSLENKPVFFQAVMHCLKKGKHWRALSDWRAPRSPNPARVFDSLATHLLIRYPMPDTMYRTVLEAVTEWEKLDCTLLDWFLHVASGDNLCRADGLPFEFTKKAAHYLQEAPEDLELIPAMRWAQVRAMGGSEEAATIFASELYKPYGDFEPEWTAVMHFSIRHWNEKLAEQMPHIISFIRSQRLENLVVWVSDIEQSIQPLFPDFDIRQATEKSLMARMATWEMHVESIRNTLGQKPFPKPGLADHYEIDTTTGTVHISRLPNISALLREGAIMRHCVGNYGSDCLNSSSSIWTVRLPCGRPLATVELWKSRTIGQFSGKANSEPGPEAREAVVLWAKMEGLEL